MKRVLVPLANGFEEIEAVTVIDVLRRAGAEVFVAGLKAGPVLGSHSIEITPDGTLDQYQDLTFAMVCLPGGMPGAANLRDDPRIIDVIKKVQNEGGFVAAICAAPIALSRAGILKNRKATSYPAFRDQIDSSSYSEDPVVVDNAVITSRGVGTALEFSLELVRQLYGTGKAKELGDAMLVK